MWSHSSLRLGALLSAMMLTVAGACAVGGFELGEKPPTTTTGAGGAAGGGGAGGSGLACEHARWPDPPGVSDPGAEDLDFVLAARSFDFGEEDLSNRPTVGHDLDDTCTCQGQGDSCREPEWAVADHCDGPAGRDNAIAQLFHELGTFDEDFTSANYTDDAEVGKDTLLIRVRAYNGQPNDHQLIVSLHPSVGVDDDPCNPPDSVAAWDGSDMWAVNAASLAAGQGGAGGGAGGSGSGGGPSATCGPNGFDIDAARYVDYNAYVTDGTLVANLPDVPLEFTSGDDSLPVQLKAGFVTGRLEERTSGWHLTGALIVGRWTVAEFFKMIGSITSQHVPLCTDHPLYPLLKGGLCRYPDIASGLVGPTTPCDALSFGVAIEAEPAQIGSVLPAFVHQRLCPPETDPLHDSCDSE